MARRNSAVAGNKPTVWHELKYREDNMRRLRFILMPILCLLWIGIIFAMSSDVNSNSKSKNISQKIETTINVNNSSNLSSSKASVNKINYFIRKSSHFVEFLILGILLYYTAFVYSLEPKTSLPCILFLILLIANLDEFYQSFVGRTSKVTDSLIDLCGGIVGILIGIMVRYFNDRLHRR